MREVLGVLCGVGYICLMSYLNLFSHSAGRLKSGLRAGLCAVSAALVSGACLLPAAAQPMDDDSQWAAQAEQLMMDCLDTAGSTDESCIGTMIRACPDADVSTASAVRCASAELAFWQDRLDTTFERLVTLYAEEDEAEIEYAPYRLAIALESMQDAWVEWRDARCGFAYAKYRGGTLGRIDRAYCLNEFTAKQYFEIDGLLQDGGF